MLSDSSRSLNNFVKAFSILSKPWAVKYVIFSALLSFIVFLLFLFLAYQYGDDIGSYFYDLIPIKSSFGWFSVLMEWISRLLLILIIIFAFKYIVLIITAPLMSVLSEKVEKHYGGGYVEPVGISGQLKSVVRGSTLAIGNLLKELFISIPVLALSLIPGVFVFSTPFLFLIQSYFAGFGNFDFYMERHLNIRESKKFARQNRMAVSVNGALFLMLLIIPVIGVLLAPSVGTIAATLTGVDLMDDGDF